VPDALRGKDLKAVIKIEKIPFEVKGEEVSFRVD
jgi:hypothetical protein